jgi:hypothetical protein
MDYGMMGTSYECRSVIASCLHPMPQRRPTASFLLANNGWFSKYQRDDDLETSEVLQKRKEAILASGSNNNNNNKNSGSSVPSASSSGTQKKMNLSGLFPPSPKLSSSASETPDELEAQVVAAASIATNAARMSAQAQLNSNNLNEEEEDEDEEAVEVVSELSNIMTVEPALPVTSATTSSSSSSSSPRSPLPRTCSDIGVGSGSLFHENTTSSSSTTSSLLLNQKTLSEEAPINPMIHGPSATLDGGYGAEDEVDSMRGGGGWWVGVLGPHSAFICPLTKKPFVDPVISVADGVTYEREALAKRNLSK